MTRNSDEYLKELDVIFNSVLVQQSLLNKLNNNCTSSSYSNSSEEILASPKSDNDRTSSSSSPSGSFISKSSTNKTRLKFNHEFSETYRVSAASDFMLTRQKANSENNIKPSRPATKIPSLLKPSDKKLPCSKSVNTVLKDRVNLNGNIKSNRTVSTSTNSKKKSRYDDTDLDASISAYSNTTTDSELRRKTSKTNQRGTQQRKNKQSESSLTAVINLLQSQNGVDLSNLVGDLLLINLLHSNQKSLTGCINEFVKYTASKAAGAAKKSSSSLCSSSCSLNSLGGDDNKSTSTKIHRHRDPSPVKQHVKPHLEIPNIEDPMQFIDNLYNQILAQSVSEKEPIKSMSSMTDESAGGATFNVNNDFSFIDLYSNVTNENRSEIEASGDCGMLAVKNKNLVDWNYEEEEEDALVSRSSNTVIDVDPLDSNPDTLSQSTVISNRHRSELHSIEQSEPSWLMMKLLNSCADLRPSEDDETDQETPRPPEDQHLYKENESFNISTVSSAISSTRSSTSTAYMPIRSPLFVQSKPPSNSGGFPFIRSIFKSIGEVFSWRRKMSTTTASYLFPTAAITTAAVIVFIVNMRLLKRSSSITISSASGLSSSMMQASSLTTAATARASLAAVNSLASLASSFL